MKVYKSKSQVSINIKIGDGHAHINFSSITAGGSVFYTDDAEVQKGIESHPKFGKLFKFDREILPEPELTEAKVSEESREETIQKIKVSDLNSERLSLRALWSKPHQATQRESHHDSSI